MGWCFAGFSIWGTSAIILVWFTRLTFIQVVQKTYRQMKKLFSKLVVTKSCWLALASGFVIWVGSYCRKWHFPCQSIVSRLLPTWIYVGLLCFTHKICAVYSRHSELVSNNRKWRHALCIMYIPTNRLLCDVSWDCYAVVKIGHIMRLARLSVILSVHRPFQPPFP